MAWVIDDNGTESVNEDTNIADGDMMSPGNATAVFDWNSSLTVAPDEDCWMTLQCQLETTRFVVQKLIVPFVVTFGVLGNAVTVAVLTRPWMKSSTNSYLTALAVYDLLYLVLDSNGCVLDLVYNTCLVREWLHPVACLRPRVSRPSS